jgi:capsular exopolysaccharide synthesis family protein
MENLNRPKREPNDFDLKVFLSRYFKYWYIFAFTLVVSLLIARYYNWYTNPIYAVTAKLLVKDENYGKDKLLQQLEIDKPSKNIENEIEILRSHSLLAKVLNELDFEVSYFLVGDVKVSEVYKDCPFSIEAVQLDYGAYFDDFTVTIINGDRYEFTYEAGDEPKVYEHQFGDTLNFGLGDIIIRKRDNFPYTRIENPNYDKKKYLVRFNTIAYNQNKYLSKLSISLSRSQATILQIYLEDEVPQKGLDFVNKLIEVYLRNDIETKKQAATATADFLDSQLNDIASDLERIETSRENYKVSKGIVDLESESKIVLEGIKDLDAQKALNSSRLGMIRQLKSYIKQNQDLRDLAPAALDISDPLLIKLINKLSELQSEREIILNRSTANDPMLIPINAEIELTRSSLLENIQNIEKSLESKQADLEQSLRDYRNRISRIPTTERELLEIERQFRIQESLYLFLLEKRAELAISLSATESNTRIIDSARVLPGPISPVPQRAYSIAIIISILLPIFIIILIEKFNDKVTELSTIRKLTDIPVLGQVRLSKQNSSLVAINKPRSSIAEEYRSIRTNLRFFSHDSGPSVIMVTSSVGTEGKTFTAMNLAAVMAASGAKVVLVGLDMRKPRIVEDFQIANDLGCSNYLSGNAQLDEVIQASGFYDNLDIIPSGPTPPNPSELVLSDNMDRFIEELKNKYDRIIIDTPPIGLVSDGLIIANHADATLFVVRDGVTRKNHLAQVNDLYKKNQLKNLSIVFNAIRKRPGAYGYNAGYGYGYGGYAYGSDYGNYFDDEEQEKSFMRRWFKSKR